MKAHRRHGRHVRRNPHGTLLVNPRRAGKSHKRAKKGGFSIHGIMKRLGIRRNPLLVSNPKRRGRKSVHVKGYSRRRNPLVINPMGSLVMNPRHRKHAKRARRNPLLVNPIHIRRRRNPDGGGSFVGLQKMARRLPIIGGLLAGTVGVLGSAIGGAVGVYPTAYALPYVAKWIPSWLKPFGYTVAGALISAAISMIPVNSPLKTRLAIGVAAAGGAVDAYRFKHGKSQDLGEYDSLLSGDETGDVDGDETGDVDGDDYGDIGDDGAPFAATEYADADLRDADYMGDGDLSDAEIAAAELGRQHFARRFRVKRQDNADGEQKDGASEHAGKPGRRHAWMIYWIGFDNFQKLAQLDEAQRREAVEHMRREAKLVARKLLSEGAQTTVTDAETAGLMVAA